MSKDNLWQDKLAFSEKVVYKELEMISQYTAIINQLKFENYPIDRIRSLQSYKFCWANLNNLYQILINDYEKQLDDNDKTRLKEIIDIYNDINKEETLENLKEAKEIILKIMSKAGFHDLVRTTEDDDF